MMALCSAAALTAQGVSGRVTNEFGEPVPFANVLVQETGLGTTTDDEGRYQLNLTTEGSYRLIFSSLGYESYKETVIVTLAVRELDVRLTTSDVKLNEITVNASKRDPAYAIIRKVVERRAAHLRGADSYRTKVYVKATENVDRRGKKKKAAPPPPPAEDAGPPDPFAAERARQRQLLGSLNFLEMEVTLNFARPRRYKEERTAYRAYGRTKGLFVPRFGETDFNFYRNMVRLTGISDAPVISPLSATGVLSYKFKLESTDLEGDQIVYRIRVTPRKRGNSTCRGTLWINGGSYTINRLDLTFSPYPLKFFDAFRLEQRYAHQDSADVWTVDRQVFHYAASAGRGVKFDGTTTLSYSDYEHNYAFPERFFGNEIAVTTREAYDRDSTYWTQRRTVALTEREAEVVRLRDSIKAVTSSQAYQDSLQRRYNKITPLELVWDGVGFRNNAKKSHLYVGSIPELIGYSVVGGWEINPYVAYNRRYPNGKMINVSGSLGYGFLNNNVTGNYNIWHRYDAFRLGDVSSSGGRSFESIFPNDAYLNQLRPSNYILKDAVRGRHQIELLNGFFWVAMADFTVRRPISGFRTSTLFSGLVDDNGEEVLEFEAYNALIVTNVLHYTPGQKYLREPDRKIRLASKWPTFRLLHRKGLDGPLNSAIDFDYLEISLDHNLVLGTLGYSNYQVKTGKFVNTDNLRFIDFKRFRQADPLLLSDPSRTFNALDTALTTTDLFVEVHHIHHFNGAIINNIPLLRKTRIRTLAGAGLLYLPSTNYRYQEVFVGLERVFKIGARRRLRLGGYAVLGDGTGTAPVTSFKVSFDIIDLWKRDWSF